MKGKTSNDGFGRSRRQFHDDLSFLDPCFHFLNQNFLSSSFYHTVDSDLFCQQIKEEDASSKSNNYFILFNNLFHIFL